MIYDLRFTIYDLRFMIYDLRFTIYDLRFIIYDLNFKILHNTIIQCDIIVRILFVFVDKMRFF